MLLVSLRARQTPTGARLRASRHAGWTLVLREPLIEGGGFLRVLVDLVFAELPPAHLAPDDEPVVVDALAIGRVQPRPAADADGALPRQTTDDHLVGLGLDTHPDQALEPGAMRGLAVVDAAPRVLAREYEQDVLGVERQRRPDVARPRPRHQVADQPLAKPRKHRTPPLDRSL